MGKVVVWPTKFVRGWSGDTEEQDINRFPIMDVREACEQDWETDAHFVPYYVDGFETMPRLNQSSLNALAEDGYEVSFDLLVIDVDSKDAHKNEVAATDEWRTEQLALLKQTPWWDTAGFYETRGGYRLLWELPSVMGPKDYISYLKQFVIALKGYGIDADDLTDWNRTYRLPRVVRDRVAQDPELDLDDLGKLAWEPTVATSNAFSGISQTNAPLVVPDEIVDGNRNKLLARIAGKYRRMGMEQDEIVGALEVVNQARCNPPVEMEELIKVAKSICKYAPPESSQGDNLGGPLFQLGSDNEIAEVTCSRIENPDGPKLVFDRSELWQYQEGLGIWEKKPLELVRKVIHTFDGEKIQAGVDRNGDPKTTPLKVGQRLCVNVTSLICDRRYHKGFFDTAKDGLTFANCFVYVNKDGLQIEDISPSQRATARLDFDFSYGHVPHKFIDTLKSCFKDDADADQKVALLQQFIGLCLLGGATKYQKGLILLGAGANGKSTVQKIIGALFANNLISAIPPQDMSQEYRRAMLADSRLNLVNELPEAEILASESVKAMISGDLMVGRHIRQSPFEFIPKAGHIFAANALPGVRDMSLGFWRRWLVLTFNRTFKKHEQIPGLAEGIIQSELPAIASWALEGAAHAYANGYTIPPSSKMAIEKWRSEADQVATFLEYLYEGELEDREPASKIYNDYCLWASNSGHRHMSAVKFSKRLHQLGVEKIRTKQGNFYIFQQIRPSFLELH
mgnify:CR=1 FL=1